MTTRFERKEASLMLSHFIEGGLMKHTRSYRENETYIKEYKLIIDGKIISVASLILSEDNFEIKLMSESYKFGFSIISYTKN